MLTNTRFGALDNLPFDFDRHRASPYKAAVNMSRSQKNDLRERLETALEAMVSVDPERPGAELSPEQKRRRCDIPNLTELLNALKRVRVNESYSVRPEPAIYQTDAI
jgi:hypothetical protein